MGIFQITFIVLLILQLTGTIFISWWFVFLPLLIPFLIVILFLITALLLCILGLIKD